MNGWTKRVATLVAAASLALVGLASASSSATAQGSVRGVTKSEITIGGISTSMFFGDNVAKAAQARFDAANKNGELPGGRKINFVGVADDKNTPDVGLSEVRRLTEQERVFAIVPSMSSGINVSSYLAQQKLPLIGWGVSPTQCQPLNRYAYGINGCLIQYGEYNNDITGPTFAAYAKAQGKDPKQMSAAVIGENYDASKAGTQSVASSLRLADFNVVYAESPIPGAPTVVTDFSPYVQALMTANRGQPPDLIYFANGGANLFGLLRGLTQAGYKGMMIHSTYAPQVTVPAAGTYAINTFATAEESIAAMDKIRSTLSAAGINPIGQGELAAYYSADMLIQILKEVGKNVTPDTFQKVASNFTYEIPGVVGPSYYPAGYKVGAPCSSLMYSDGTKWSVAVKFACYGGAMKKKGDTWVHIKYPEQIK